MQNNVPQSNATIPALRHATLQDIVHGLGDGHFTVEQLVNAYPARINEVNHEFHAVIQTNPDAIKDARLLDQEEADAVRLPETFPSPTTSPSSSQTSLHSNELHDESSYGPLRGVPFLIKGNIATLDTTETTCGSLALVGARPSKEADIVTALRSAGAIILGKINMAE